MNFPRLLCLLLPLISASASILRADGPADNLSINVRRMPPAGVAIPEDVRRELTLNAAELKQKIETVRAEFTAKNDTNTLRYLPDVEIYHKAVDWALRYDEFYDVKQTKWSGAEMMLKEGFDRLKMVESGDPLPNKISEVHTVRGYRSKIDGSVQPFGLVLPMNYDSESPHKYRLDIWFHGRGEKLTELDFIWQRMTDHGEFAPRDTIVLHTYGRYCNGQRFAGETDLFEALEVVKRDYKIDEDRISVRGFSLGGAACWHIAAHHGWQWCAANPGAGFSETEQFLNFFQGEKLQPPPWERKLWNLYDSTAVAGNFFNIPTVAYSGEIDKQKQAADLMAEALKKEGMELTHIIGPKTAHKYEPGAKAEVARRVDALAAQGRRQRNDLKFQTFTLKYNKTDWITIDGLQEHWQQAEINAVISPRPEVRTKNVTALTVVFDTGKDPFEGKREIRIDGSTLSLPAPRSDRSLHFPVHREGENWIAGPLPDTGISKKHNLQGPIDDAFMDSFIFVRPTGQAANEKTGEWAKAEMERAIEHWRRHFRGDARVKDDTAITEEDIKSANLILWGDPASNAVMAKVAAQLPVSWSGTEIKAGEKTFPAAEHALICIYPNPLNPERYVVLNSSFTFREYDYLNNARQTPKLPDWAVIDLKIPPDARRPGGIAAADFFGEKWELK